MATVWVQGDRDALLGRLDKLTPATKPRWGQFTVGKMMKHCADAVRMATGELPVKPRPGIFSNYLVSRLIIHVLPWPQGAPTAPELIPPTDPDFAATRDDLRRMIGHIATADRAKLANHPAFGKLSERSWGVLIYKHIDHHLKQFGV